jgi:hypothetical protein
MAGGRRGRDDRKQNTLTPLPKTNPGGPDPLWIEGGPGQDLILYFLLKLQGVDLDCLNRPTAVVGVKVMKLPNYF